MGHVLQGSFSVLLQLCGVNQQYVQEMAKV